MIDASLAAWGLMLALVLLASAAGCALASCFPWSESARRGALPLAWGIGLGPLLLGLAVVAALAVAPGARHGVHLGIAAALLACLFAVGFRRRDWRLALPPHALGGGWIERALLVLLVLWIAGLLANALLVPLTQNDSLEYAIVGRALFEARSLGAYPQIHPDAGSSGFFGPWTHPPLYVALLYIANVVQGHADAPGLMRLVAPWGLIAATGVVRALGAQVSRRAGLLAALVTLSTPLLFLGADSALLDALPVLGLLLAAAAIVGIESSSTRRGLALGLALALALWTHSQAVLFIPLAGAALLARNGWRHPRPTLREAAVAGAVVLVLASWPYLRNLALFGSLVSDNPRVFALPQQAWPDYFRTGRGVDHWTAIVQYGWFKGWSALEAYGFAFWILLLGLALRGKPAPGEETQSSVFRVSLALLGCYLLGVVASTLLGLDLMIKNERYLLVVVPFVALAGALGLQRAFGRRALAVPLALAFVGLFSAQLVALVAYRFVGAGVSASTLARSHEEKLQGTAEYETVKYLREHTPRDALVLSLKPADMYYAQRRMLSYLDPRLEPFYRTTDPAEALAQLRALGVTHVHLPDYGIPPLYNSALHRILRSPQWTTLAFQARGNQVYALRPSGLAEAPARDLLAPGATWTRSSSLVIGGRKALSSLLAGVESIDITQPSEPGLPLGLFHREWSNHLTLAGYPPGGAAAAAAPGVPVTGGQEVGIDLSMEGHGLVRLWLQQFDERGPIQDDRFRGRSRVMLSDLQLGGRYAERQFSRRVRLLPAARFASITLEQVGSSRLHLRAASFVPLAGAEPGPAKQSLAP